MKSYTTEEFNALMSEKKQIIVEDKDFKNITVSGICLDDLVPHFYLRSQKTSLGGTTRYYFRVSENKKLFLYALYNAFEAFMKYIGLNPYEFFEYYTFEKQTHSEDKIILMKKRDYRLIIKEKNNGLLSKYPVRYRSLYAILQTHDPRTDFGLKFQFHSRSAEIYKQPYVMFTDENGDELEPEVYLRKLLLTLNYPIYIYNYQLKKGWLARLIGSYSRSNLKRKEQQKKHDFSVKEIIEQFQ